MMDNSYAYSEVLDVLSNMEQKYVDKIPKKLIEYLKYNSSNNYKKHIDSYIDLKEQTLSKKALNILALINLKYWTIDEEHKQKLLKQYRENEEKLKKINGLDKVKTEEELFRKDFIQENKSLEIVKQKETIFKKIKNLFINIKKNKRRN